MHKNISGFTLIELLIVITISMILMTMTFANYNYFQNVAKVKMSAKMISQSISSARNAAIAGYQANWVNQKIGVYFHEGEQKITYYNFAYNSWVVLAPQNIMKEEKLPDGVAVSSSWALIVFSSLFGTGGVYNPLNGEMLSQSEKIKIEVTFKQATSSNLKRTIYYSPITNTIDY